jgi:nitronate monooxygenase
MSPFALVSEVREFYDGPILLSGAIANGASILAAQAIGADLAYMGTRFIASKEANASDEYKQAIVDSGASDIVYTNLFTGIHGNYLRSSIIRAGLDPDDLASADKTKMNFGSTGVKAWRDIWGGGQSSAMVKDVPTVAELVTRLEIEYRTAIQRLEQRNGFATR